MKKIFCFLAAAMLLLGCDDGDMTFKTFDFTAAQTQTCSESNILFKVNATEVLILDIIPSAFINKITPENTPRIIEVGGSSGNTITYRNYDGPVTTNTICSIPPAATPTVIDEWKGEGTIEIITREVRNDDNQRTGFTHQITLKSISFDKGGETITITDNNFGTVNRDLGFSFNFIDEEAEVPEVRECEENKLVYTRKLSEALILSFQENTFANVVGSKPDIILGGIGNVNQVLFKVYGGNISDSHICDALPPLTPTVQQQWTANSGTVKINTTFEGGTYNHEVRFHNVIFSNSFTGETFNISDIIPIDEASGYLFGTHTTNP